MLTFNPKPNQLQKSGQPVPAKPIRDRSESVAEPQTETTTEPKESAETGSQSDQATPIYRHSFGKVTAQAQPSLRPSAVSTSKPGPPRLQLFIQPKLTVNQPNDSFEQEADRIADQIMQPPAPNQPPVIRSVPMSNVAETVREATARDKKQTTEQEEPQPSAHPGRITDLPLQRKPTEPNQPTVSKAVEQTIQSDGKPLDNATRLFMSKRFGHDFRQVRIHDDALAHRASHDIQARAYTHRHHIVFGAGQYQPHTDIGKRLLAHELTHVIQQRAFSSLTLQRQTNPATVNGFTRLPESIYVVAKVDLFLEDAPGTTTTLKNPVTLKDERLELTWKSGDWYYAVSESGTEGYVKATSLVFPPAINPKKAPTEEYVAILHDTIFIQAPDMHRAFVLAKQAKLIPNSGMIFWYSNGKIKPYPVSYTITIREPSADEIEKMQKVAGFGAVASRITAGSTPTTGTAAVAGLTLTPAQVKWQAAEKELAPYVDEFLLQPSQQVPDEMVMNVPNESLKALNYKFEEFRVKKGFPYSQDDDSDFVYYYTVFQLLIRAKIKETITHSIYKPTKATGGLEWFVESQQRLVKENDTYLHGELDKIVKEEQEKRKADIAAFFKPYNDAFQSEQKLFIEKAKKQIEQTEGWYNREVAQKAAEKVLKTRHEEVMKQAQADFAKSALAKEIQAAVDKRYAEVEKTITHPDPYKDPTISKDATLVALIQKYDAKFSTAVDFKSREAIFREAKDQIGTHITFYYPDTHESLKLKVWVYFSNKLLVNDKGEITIYAIKKWAAQNRDDIQKAIEKFSPIFHNRFQKDAQQMHLMDLQSMTAAAYTDLAYELMYAKEFFDKVIDHPENDEGFWAGFTSKSLGEFLPFIHSILSMSKLYEQMRVSNKKLMGGTLTVSEELLLKAAAALLQVNEMKKKPFWYRVGEGVAETIPFIAEFIITAPIGLGTGAIAEKVTESAMRKIATQYMEKQVVKLIIKGTGALVGAFFQTLANPLDIEKNIMAHRMNIVSLVINPDGSITVEVAPSKESEASAIWKGFVTSYVNVFTERLGGKLLPFLGGKIASKFGRFIPMAVRSNVFTRYLKITSEALKKYTGFHGILGEYEEEVYGQILESLLKGEHLKWSWDDQAQTFMVVAIMGAPMKGLQHVFVAYEIMRTLKFNGKNVVLPAHIYTALSQLTSESAMTDFEALLEKEKLSADQKALAQYMAGKILNVEHEITLTQEQQVAQGLTQPPGTLPRTIKELASLAIDLYKARKNLLLAKQAGKTDAIESVILLGDEGAKVPLLLYTIEQADKWILETEIAIAQLEGLTLTEIREAAQVGVGIEARIKLWTQFAAGWRPYIQQAKTLSPGSTIALADDGFININGNVVMSRLALIRMLVMDKTNLNRLLTASLDVKKEIDAGSTPLSMDAESQKKIGQLHSDSSVTTDAGLTSFNDQIKVTGSVLQRLKKVEPAPAAVDPSDKKKKEAKKKPETFTEFQFLFDNSYGIDKKPIDYAQLGPEDKAAITGLHPTSVLTDIGTDFVSINNQVQVSNTFLKELLLNDKAQLQRLLVATFNLNQAGGDIQKLSEADWKSVKDLNKTGGLRIRFTFHYETELQQFISNTGLNTDARFTALWAKATLGEKVRMWDLFNEIGGYNEKKRERVPDTMPDLRKQANDFALSMHPADLFEMVDYYQYYTANFAKLVDKVVADYTARLNTNIQTETTKVGKELTNKERIQVERSTSLAEFGESFEGVGSLLTAAARKKQLTALSDPAKGAGYINSTTFTDLQAQFKGGEQALQGKLGAGHIKPGLMEADAVKAIKSVSNLSFSSTTAAVYHVEKHHHELPDSMQNATQPAQAYLDAARKAVAEAQQVTASYNPAEAGVRSFVFTFTYEDPTTHKKYDLKSIVKELPNGTVSFATLIIIEQDS